MSENISEEKNKIYELTCLIYNEYHKQTFFITKNFYPRRVTNFEKHKDNPNWVHFQKLAEIIYRSGNHIDYRIYISALIDFYKNKFDPSILHHPKSIKIYKNYVNIINTAKDNAADVQPLIIDNLKFICNYCADNNLTINDYFEKDKYLIPILAKHFSSGSVSIFLLSVIPDIYDIIKHSYPQDVIEEYFFNIEDQLKVARQQAIRSERVRVIADNFFKLADSCINKIKENRKENNIKEEIKT